MFKFFLSRCLRAVFFLCWLPLCAYALLWLLNTQAGAQAPSLWEYLVGLAQGDLSSSRLSGRPVAELLERAAGRTLSLVGAAAVIAFCVGGVLGVYAGALEAKGGVTAERARATPIMALGAQFAACFMVYCLLRSAFDANTTLVGLMVYFWAPNFLFVWVTHFLAYPLLLLLIARTALIRRLRARALRMSARFAARSPSMALAAVFLGVLGKLMGSQEAYNSAVVFWLAAVALATRPMAQFFLALRQKIRTALEQDDMRLAMARGVRRRRLVWRRAAPNALLDDAESVQQRLAALIALTPIIETVFTRNGLGALAAVGLRAADGPVAAGAVIVFGAMFIIIDFLMAILVAWADPTRRPKAKKKILARGA